jgi:hypothetical protein
MGPMDVPTTRQASCGLAIVTTVAAVGLSLKQGNAKISSASAMSPIVWAHRCVQRL